MKRLIVAVAMLAAVVFVLPRLGMCMFAPCPVAPWITQAATAQRFARGTALDARITKVYATARIWGRQTTNTTLETYFEYATPTGQGVAVVFDDTNPHGSAKVDTAWSSPDPPNIALEQVLKRVTITPAVAFRNTLAEGRAFMHNEEGPTSVIIALEVAPNVPGAAAVPVAWGVLYTHSTTAPTTLRIWVDAQTGSVVGRRAN